VTHRIRIVKLIYCGQALHTEEVLFSFLPEEECPILPLLNLMKKLQTDLIQNSK